MNELGKFCPPPRLTATPRQVERVTQLLWKSANAACLAVIHCKLRKNNEIQTN
jgi:hypothetical protein